MSDYYDKKGKPMEMMEWAKLLEDREYKIIKQENSGKYWVSTVWLGLNHNYVEGKPLIFETMVFPKSKDKTDYGEVDMERYSTEEEAIKGHKEMVKKWNKKQP